MDYNSYINLGLDDLLLLKKFRYHQNNSDHILFIKWQDNHVILLIIYIDDMIFIRNDYEKKKKIPISKFEMKN
jgi:hypothetical protein